MNQLIFPKQNACFDATKTKIISMIISFVVVVKTMKKKEKK